MGKLFEGLKKGMQEVVAHKGGKITLKSEFIEIPEPPKEYGSKKLRAQKLFEWNEVSKEVRLNDLVGEFSLIN